MELPLDENQLAKPTYEAVRPVFDSVVATLTGVTREELQQPVFMAIDTLEFPELHDESIPTLAFVKQLTRLMLTAGVRDFCMKDLYKPDAQRLRKHLSAIINFAKFREEKLGPYTDLQEQFEGLYEEKCELEDMRGQLDDEVQRVQHEHDVQQPQVAQLEAETREIYQKNLALNLQQKQLHEQAQSLKEKANQLTNDGANEKFKLAELSQECDALKQQIVESPERVQAALEGMQAEAERERGALADAEQRARDLQARLDTISKVEKEIQKLLKLMEGVEADIGRKKEVSRKVKELRTQIAANEGEAAQLAAQQQHLKRQQAGLLERLSRLEHQSKLKREAAASVVEEQLKDKEAIEAENAATFAKLAENDALMRSTAAKDTRFAKTLTTIR